MPALHELHKVPLDADSRQLLQARTSVSVGSPMWRARQGAEAHDLLALAQLSPRLVVLDLRLEGELRALVGLAGPVPTCPRPGVVEVRDRALLALRYPLEALSEPLAGWAFVNVLEPRGLWLPNAAQVPEQRLCLGVAMPVGIPLRELVLASWAALTLQAVQLDPRDPAGVLNLDAARWWQDHQHALPLTRASLLSAPGPDEAQAAQLRLAGLPAPASRAAAQHTTSESGHAAGRDAREIEEPGT